VIALLDPKKPTKVRKNRLFLEAIAQFQEKTERK
jgi:hypothetical protein